MPYTAAGKHAMLNALGALATHIGILDAATPITTVTGVTSTDTFTKTSHGLSNGDLVVLSSLTGGSGLVAGAPYFVVAQATNTFQLSLTSGGSAVDLGTDVTSVTVTELVEVTGGSPAYSREAATWATAAAGSMDESTGTLSFDMPASSAADYAGAYSASTTGTLYAIDALAGESFVAQGVFELTDADLDLNAA